MKKFIYTIIALLGILMPNTAWAAEDSSYDEAYAVLVQTFSEDGSTLVDSYLTMYYDNKKSEHTEGIAVGLDEMLQEPNILEARRSIHSAIFDESFANCRPTSTNNWFSYCMELKTISGMEYLNTSEVTDMGQMFMECANLESLDLSHFNTSKVTTMNNMFFFCERLQTLDLSSFNTENVTDMSYMFGNCMGLTTIYASGYWTTASVTESEGMFSGCRSLVGGAGTTYSEDHTDKDFAHIDRADQPGYFTYGESSGEKKEQVATPTWNFQNEMLVLSTETADASIYYATANWENEEETDSIANTIDVSTRSTLYQNPLEITDNIIIKMIAAKEGMENSEVATFVYDYKSWMELYDAIRYGVDVLDKARDNVNVEEGLLEELRWALNEGDMMYQRRAEMSNQEAKYFTDAIINICMKIEEQMNVAIELTQDDDGYYLLGSADDWKGFATLVSRNPAANAKMTADIDLGDNQTMIASVDDPEKYYQGHFDGQGHTLNVNYIVEYAVAPFRYISNATIENLHVTGRMEANQTSGVGGIVAVVGQNDVATVRRCWTSALLVASTETSDQNTIGGIVSHSYGNIVIEDCLFDGQFGEENVRYNGGFIANSWGTLTITNSLNVGTYPANEEYVSGTVYRPDQAANDPKLENVYYKNVCGTPQGEQVNDEQLTNGTVVSLLQNGRTEEIWKQGDTYPVLYYAANSGKKDQVATPTWGFQNEMLVLSTETADASIYYATANWENEAETDSIANTIDVSTRSTLYQNPIEITDNIIIKMIAAKEGMDNSEVATFVYDYKSWKELYDAIRYGVDVLDKARDNANVEEGLLEELRWALNEGDMMYQRRAEMSNQEAKYFTETIFNICKKIEEQMNAGGGELEAYACQNGEDGSMLTFFYNDARSVNGGYLIEEFRADSLVAWREIKEQIRYVAFDSSFANFRPNSTAHWFEGFSNLENVSSLENLNTSEVYDMEAMFAGCKKLTTLAGIETLNTSNVVNMYRMFTECSSLEYLDVSHFDTSNSVITCNMFSFCSSLESLDVSGFNTSKVGDFSHMFAGCTNLKSIDVSHFNTSNGVHMGSIFAQCSSLTSIDLSSFNTEKAEGMSMLFQDCTGLTDIDVSHFNTSNVTSIDRMFDGCTGLTTLDLSNFNTGKVTAIFQMFKDCSNLKTIYVSDKWTTDSVKEGFQVFANCQSIVGGAGTQFNPEHTDYYYAHVDGGTANPGYLTDKDGPQAIAEFDSCVLRVEGQASMAEALEQVGGREEVAKNIAAIIWNSTEAITSSDIEGFGNPNLLIYVQRDSLAPEGLNNVIIDGKAKNIVLVDADSINNNFYAPLEFTAENIQYTREFKQTTEKDVSRGWEGICLPFNVETYTHESHGAIAPFRNDASEYHFWLHQMTDQGMQIATTIEANKPYIISMPNNGSYPAAYNQAGKVTFAAKNVRISESIPWAMILADGSIGIAGAYQSIAYGFYALNVGSEYEGYAEGSVFVNNYRAIRPFEVYGWHNGRDNEGAGARIISLSSLFGGNGTTGIIDVMNTNEPTGDTWYDLNGRRLQSKPARKGVYIKNGKKVVVK